MLGQKYCGPPTHIAHSQVSCWSFGEQFFQCIWLASEKTTHSTTHTVAPRRFDEGYVYTWALSDVNERTNRNTRAAKFSAKACVLVVEWSVCRGGHSNHLHTQVWSRQQNDVTSFLFNQCTCGRTLKKGFSVSVLTISMISEWVRQDYSAPKRFWKCPWNWVL